MTAPARQPSGTPAGGQFASTAHGEPDHEPLAEPHPRETDTIVIDPAPPIPLSGLRGRDGAPLAGDPLLAAVVARTGLDAALERRTGTWEDLRCFAAACGATGLDITDEQAGAVVRSIGQARTGAVHAGVAVADAWRTAARIVDRLLPGEPGPDGRRVVEDPSWTPAAYSTGMQSQDPTTVDRLLAEHDQWQVRRQRLHAEAEAGTGSYEDIDSLDSDMWWISGDLANQLRRVTHR